MIAFGLDGCLAATAREDWAGGPAYLRQVAAGFTALSAWEAAEQLSAARYSTSLLSSAPPTAFSALIATARSWPFVTHRFGATPEQKAVWLAKRAASVHYSSDEEFTYVAAADDVDVPEGWKFVRYDGQSAAELYAQVLS